MISYLARAREPLQSSNALARSLFHAQLERTGLVKDLKIRPPRGDAVRDQENVRNMGPIDENSNNFRAQPGKGPFAHCIPGDDGAIALVAPAC